MSWFTDLASQAFQLADTISATIAASANQAEEEIIAEQNKVKASRTASNKLTTSHLPWETSDETLAILTQDLMERILRLSWSEKNFTTTVPTPIAPNDFDFTEFVPVAMKMIALDSNLSRMHAKLSPKMNEQDFWYNYYCRIQYLRGIVGIDGPDKQELFKPIAEDTVIHEPTESREISAVLSIIPQSELSDATETTLSGIADEALTVKNEARRQQAQADLAAEVEAVLSDDDIDLADLEDDLQANDDDDDFENIGNDSDSELEAQIARELSQSP